MLVVVVEGVEVPGALLVGAIDVAMPVGPIVGALLGMDVGMEPEPTPAPKECAKVPSWDLTGDEMYPLSATNQLDEVNTVEVPMEPPVKATVGNCG